MPSTSKFDSRVFALLEQVTRLHTPSFTGLGLVFYRNPMSLPACALGDQSLFEFSLPAEGSEHIADILSRISQADSNWHDGFHLIEVDEFKLTHVCQFLSPSPELLSPPSPGNLPIGARQKSAMAISRLPSVACAALINSRGEAQVFLGGALLKGGD